MSARLLLLCSLCSPLRTPFFPSALARNSSSTSLSRESPGSAEAVLPDQILQDPAVFRDLLFG